MRIAVRRAIVAALVASTASSGLHAETIPFVSVSTGRSGAIRGATEYVVARTPEQWTLALRKTVTSEGGSPAAPTPTPPPVDFKTQMVVGVLVPGSSSCTAGTIKQVELEQSRILVTYETWRYKADQVCAEAFTLIHHFVAIPASDLEVQFVERKAMAQ
jgi:hypothetical protein